MINSKGPETCTTVHKLGYSCKVLLNLFEAKNLKNGKKLERKKNFPKNWKGKKNPNFGSTA